MSEIQYERMKSPEFWYGCGKILVKKKHTPVCPEFWYCLSVCLFLYVSMQ